MTSGKSFLPWRICEFYLALQLNISLTFYIFFTFYYSWNESSAEERHSHFLFLLSLIGGQGEQSEQTKEVLSPEYMMPMPLNNYPDLPRENIIAWCEWFHIQPGSTKTNIFEQIWDCLNSEEQNAVIADLRVFISQAYVMKNYTLTTSELDLLSQEENVNKSND